MDECDIDLQVEIIPYPVMDEYDRERLDGFLAHFESVANKTYQKLRKIRRKARPEWYHNNVMYWKNARSYVRWMRGMNRRSLDSAATTAE
jgi:hypothetical protein